MKKGLPEDLDKSCSICQYSRFIETTSQTLCIKSKDAKIVSPDFKCRHFSFDILSYRPMPLKIPHFFQDDSSEL